MSSSSSDAPVAGGAPHAFCARPASAAYVIGLMSGTSLDGVDAVVAEFPPSTASAAAKGRPRMVAHLFLPMPPTLRQQLLDLNSPSSASAVNGGELHQSMLLSNALSHLYAQSVRELLAKAQLRPDQILAIGNHGQTVRHLPSPPHSYTIQLGNSSLLAELTGIPVVADFRSRDVAAGGQGAPLVPAFHQALFGAQEGDSSEDAAGGGSVLVLNLGGIGNVTWVRRDGRVLGFDTGPANVLMDLWIQAQKIPDTGAAATAAAAASSSSAAAAAASSAAAVATPAAAPTLQFDESGRWGAAGRVIPSLLSSFLMESFFAASPPKSTGRDLFSPSWLEAHEPRRLLKEHGGEWEAQDVQATLVELTARSVAQAVEEWCTEDDERGSTAPLAPLYVCGGGAFNTHLMSRLAALMPRRLVQTTMEARGIGVEHVEALAFAWLAWRFLHGLSGNMPAVTGAKGTRILGAYYPA